MHRFDLFAVMWAVGEKKAHEFAPYVRTRGQVK